MSSIFVDPPPRTDRNARRNVNPVNLIERIESDPARSMPVSDPSSLPDDFTEGGYSEMELRIALEAVRDLETWKMPVEANFPALSDEEMRLIDTALIWFAGSPSDFITEADGSVTVFSAGYYACIGA